MVSPPGAKAMVLACTAAPSRPRRWAVHFQRTATDPAAAPCSPWNCRSASKNNFMKFNPDNNHRILVIDDNKAIHDDFRKILTRPKAAPSSLAEAEAALFGDAIPKIELPEFEIDSAFQGQEGLEL